MGAARKLVEYRRQLGADKFPAFVRECREQKRFEIKDLSIREAAEASFGGNVGESLQRIWNSRGWVQEATDATDASAFRDVIKTMSVASMEEGYTQAASNVLKMIGTFETPQQPEGEHTIHFRQSSTGQVTAVGPAMEYPRAGNASYKIAAPEPIKYGLVSCLTIEAVIANQSRQFLKENNDVGRAVGTHQVKEILKVMVGASNTFKRNGSTFNTYLTSGAWVNSVTDFDISKGPAEFDRLNKLFERMIHPVTGEPITVTPSQLMCVGMADFQVRSIMKATEIRVTNGTTTTVGTNPLLDMTIEMAKDPLIRRLLINELGFTEAQADTCLFYGNLAEAFKMREVKPFEVLETNDQTDIGFFQDIVHAAKGRWWGVPFVYDPMQVIRAYKAS